MDQVGKFRRSYCKFISVRHECILANRAGRRFFAHALSRGSAKVKTEAAQLQLNLTHQAEDLQALWKIIDKSKI